MAAVKLCLSTRPCSRLVLALTPTEAEVPSTIEVACWRRASADLSASATIVASVLCEVIV